MFIPQEFIREKRDGHALDPEALQEFIKGITDNTVSDAQIAAFCMAALLKGLNTAETTHLTMAMTRSGLVLTWPEINGPIIDKHSTGGVGDKVSLMLAPMAAACGLYVPMIAGRGLGHTGGTIDKLDCIPGFKTNLPLDAYKKTVRDIGCAIIGQTAEFAPADKRMYAVRDVTGTVESLPLITGSILSKKLAAGLQGLVMDIKVGNGAFMNNMTRARELASIMTNVAESAGLPLKAVLTDMNQVLGSTAGNAVEVREAIDYMTGAHQEKRLHDVTMQLVAEMLVLGKKVTTIADGKVMLESVLASGKAAEIFGKMIAAQGGPKDLLENPDKHLPKAPVVVDVLADRDGILNEMDTRSIGMVLVNFKAGRARVEDTINPVIGITDVQPLGTRCEAGKTVLARFHLATDNSAKLAAQSYLNCLTINSTPYTETSPIHV